MTHRQGHARLLIEMIDAITHGSILPSMVIIITMIEDTVNNYFHIFSRIILFLVIIQREIRRISKLKRLWIGRTSL